MRYILTFFLVIGLATTLWASGVEERDLGTLPTNDAGDCQVVQMKKLLKEKPGREFYIIKFQLQNFPDKFKVQYSPESGVWIDTMRYDSPSPRVNRWDGVTLKLLSKATRTDDFTGLGAKFSHN